MQMNPNSWQKVVVVAAGAALAYAAARGLRAGRPDTRTALAGPRGVHVRETLTIARPSDEVFAFWRDLTNLPRFMSHLERVEVVGNRSHWVANAPAGTTVSWDAEIINEIPGELIGWQSLEGSTVATAGSVRFTPMGPDATQLHVHLQYAPPAGRLGAWIATLFGDEPSQQIREDLRRLKTHLEGAPWRRA